MKELVGEEILQEAYKIYEKDEYLADVKGVVLNMFNHSLKVSNEVPEDWQGSTLVESDTEYTCINTHKQIKYIVSKQDTILAACISGESWFVYSEALDINQDISSYKELIEFLGKVDVRYVLELFGPNSVSLYEKEYYVGRCKNV